MGRSRPQNFCDFVKAGGRVEYSYMQKQNIGIVLVVILVFMAICACLYYFMYYEKSDDTSLDQKKPSVDVSLNSAVPAKENIKTDSTLQVQGANTVSPKSTQSKLPLPEEFEVYEQYATSETAQYQDIVVGTGLEAQNGDTLALVYKGWLTNGQLFDQNRVNDQNQIEPFVFKLGAQEVIQGWDQTVFGMKEGGKRRLVIPAKFGYGETGQGPIPPNSMLIFDVELVQVQKAQ